MKSMVGEGAGLATGFCLSPRLESRHVKDKRGSNLGANDGLARRSSFLFSPQPNGLVPLIGAAPDLWLALFRLCWQGSRQLAIV